MKYLTDMQKIREATLHDLGPLISLFRQSEEIHSLGRPDLFAIAEQEEVSQTLTSFISKPEVINLVLEIDGQVRAYLRYRISTFPNVSFLKRKGQKRCYVEEIIVERSTRRLGLGKTLLNHLEQEMKKREVDFIHLHVFSFNQNAQALYQSLGYESITLEFGKTLS